MTLVCLSLSTQMLDSNDEDYYLLPDKEIMTHQKSTERRAKSDSSPGLFYRYSVIMASLSDEGQINLTDTVLFQGKGSFSLQKAKDQALQYIEKQNLTLSERSEVIVD